MTSTIRFTVNRLESFVKSKEQVTIRDTEVAGLRFKVGKVRATFYFEKRIKNKKGAPITITLGAFPAIKLEDARQEARRLANLCEKGTDPRQFSEIDSPKHVVTLGQMIDLFWEMKKPNLSPRSIKPYTSRITKHFSIWADTNVLEITPTMLLVKYQKLVASGRISQAKEVFKAFLNIWKTTAPTLIKKYGPEAVGRNPYHQAKEELGKFLTRKAKKSYAPIFKLGELVAFLEKSRSDPNRAQGERTTYGLILYKLFTGTRNFEARNLQWRNVDLEHGVILIDPTINKTNEDHWFPISDYVCELLQELRTQAPAGKYVFPSPNDPDKPTSRRDLVYTNLSQKLGIHFTSHGPRRTFASLGHSLGLDFLKIKRMLNHAYVGGVTGGYVIPGFDPSADRTDFKNISDALIRLRNQFLGLETRTNRDRIIEALNSLGIPVEEAMKELMIISLG